MPALEHQHTASGAREVGGVNQTVMATANDDDVVFVGHAVFGIAAC
jgi:hypothetical protein